MRKASEATSFPYTAGTVCYIEVSALGEVEQRPHKNKCDRPMLKEAFDRVLSGTGKLYAVWPGNYRSDLFIIDDLDSFAKAFDFT